MGNKLGDVNTAHRMKAAMERIAIGVVNKMYPPPRFAEVVSINYTTRKATVRYPDETDTFQADLLTFAPVVAGQVVRVNGKQGARYVDEVVGGNVSLTGLDLRSTPTNYTPTIWQGAATPNVAKTITTGHCSYWKFGPYVFVDALMTVTGTGTAGQLVNVSLPMTPVIGGTLGTIEIWDSDAAERFFGHAEHNTSGGIQGAVLVSKDTGANGWGAVPSRALGNNDHIHMHLRYRV